MVDLLTRLAEIRERQGLAPMPDPTMIDGPPISHPDLQAKVEGMGLDDDGKDIGEDYADAGNYFVAKKDSSPLVPRAPKPETPEPAPGAIHGPRLSSTAPYMTFNLLVCDHEAAYQGYAVTLSQHEYASIVETVINATKRVLQDRLSEVQTKRWEEMRASQAGPETATTGDPDAGQSVPRKRGRPRKTQ